MPTYFFYIFIGFFLFSFISFYFCRYDFDFNELIRIKNSLIQRYESSSRAGGHGMVINKNTGKLQNAIEPRELDRRANFIRENANTRIKFILFIRYLYQSLFLAFVTTSFSYFVFIIYIRGYLS